MPIPVAVTAGVAGATQDEIKGLVSRIFVSVGKGFKDFYNKSKVDIETAFTEYLFQSLNRYGTVKTLLYSNEPQWIYNLYEHNYLVKPELVRSTEKSKSKSRVVTKNLLTVLGVSRLLIITGTGGSGKSMMMRHFFIDAIIKERGIIPIFVELRELTRDTTLLEVMYASVKRMGFSLEKKYFEYALQEGKFVILLDAYDEIPDNKDGRAFKEISAFCETYNKNAFIMSSRPYDSFTQWERFTVRAVSPLSKAQACSLIKKLNYDKEIKERFLKELKETLFDRHETFASIPLLLNIMLLTYEQYAEIPEKVHLFYEYAFHTLFNRHDALKGGYKRERKCNLPSDDFQKILADFCFRSYVQSQTAFTHAQLLMLLNNPCKKLNIIPEDFLDDLSLSVCILKLDGFDNYTFTHRSFQEYFTAVYLKSVSDDLQAEVGKWLIRHGRIGEAFWILQDIDNERIEKTIILPYLEELFVLIEQKETHPILLIFSFIFSSMKIHKYMMNIENLTDKREGLAYYHSGGELASFIEFGMDICRRTIEDMPATLERVYDEKAEEKVVEYLKQNYEGEANYDQLVEDPLLVDFIKKYSYVAQLYCDLKSYHQALQEKQKKQQDEMNAFIRTLDT